MDSDNDVQPAGGDEARKGEITRRQLIRRGAIVGGTLVWAVPAVQTIRMPKAGAQVSPPPPPGEAVFLVLDDEAIDANEPPNNFSPGDVTAPGGPSVAQRGILPFFLSNPGLVIDLWSGQMSDEGWFALKTIPGSWGLNGLQDFVAGVLPEAVLDPVPDVTPLRADGLCLLQGMTVAALVKDSDVSMNYGPLAGNLQGAYKGIVAFDVLSVTQHPLGGSWLPVVQIRIADATTVFGGSLTLLQGAPVPIDSGSPVDVVPCAAG